MFSLDPLTVAPRPSNSTRQRWRVGGVRSLLANVVSHGTCVVAWLGLSACGTQATGVEECKQIELARCRSGVACGLVEDLAACERYIADECRHGFPPHLGPTSSTVLACVKAIDDVGTCAKRSGKNTAPDDCDRSSLAEANGDTVCELVEHPEEIARCSFLAEPSEPDDDDDDDEADAAQPTPADEDDAKILDAATDAAE